MIWILIAAAAVVLFFYVLEKLRAYTLKAVFLKTTVSVLFIAVAILSCITASPSGKAAVMTELVMLGLVCGLLGDIWLDLKYVFPRRNRTLTYAGFVSFGIGHILFIVGMFIKFRPKSDPLYVLIPIVLAIVISIVNALLEKPMKLHYGSMKGIVILYGALLFATVLISGSLALYHEWKEKTLIFIFVGGILFAISDLVLSGTYFGKGKDRPIDIILNYVTYYPAQFFIAASLLFLG